MILPIMPSFTRHAWPVMLCMASLLTGQSVHADTVMILGDSISAGYGLRPEQSWVYKLQQRLSSPPYRVGTHTVINASVSGETTTGALGRLPLLLRTHQPHVVVVELGGNDGLRGQPPQGMAQNLSQIIQLSQKNNATVILLGMKIPPNYGNAYTQAFEQVYPRVAKQHHISLLPFLLAGVAGNPNLMQADRIHPNANAQSLLLNNAWPLIKVALSR
jgi:acyl-CoA thioesterase-1